MFIEIGSANENTTIKKQNNESRYLYMSYFNEKYMIYFWSANLHQANVIIIPRKLVKDNII